MVVLGADLEEGLTVFVVLYQSTSGERIIHVFTPKAIPWQMQSPICRFPLLLVSVVLDIWLILGHDLPSRANGSRCLHNEYSFGLSGYSALLDLMD